MKKIIILNCLIFVTVHAFGQKEYYITSEDHTKIFVEERGAGEPIVFLSGGPGLDPDYLKPVWDKVGHDHRAIILHQRGTGRSLIELVDSASMSMDNYVKDLEALRKHLQLDKITLVGHSLGGMLAMEYAARRTNHIKKLVLLGSEGRQISSFPISRTIFISDYAKQIFRKKTRWIVWENHI